MKGSLISWVAWYDKYGNAWRCPHCHQGNHCFSPLSTTLIYSCTDDYAVNTLYIDFQTIHHKGKSPKLHRNRSNKCDITSCLHYISTVNKIAAPKSWVMADQIWTQHSLECKKERNHSQYYLKFKCFVWVMCRQKCAFSHFFKFSSIVHLFSIFYYELLAILTSDPVSFVLNKWIYILKCNKMTIIEM